MRGFELTDKICLICISNAGNDFAQGQMRRFQQHDSVSHTQRIDIVHQALAGRFLEHQCGIRGRKPHGICNVVKAEGRVAVALVCHFYHAVDSGVMAVFKACPHIFADDFGQVTQQVQRLVKRDGPTTFQ